MWHKTPNLELWGGRCHSGWVFMNHTHTLSVVCLITSLTPDYVVESTLRRLISWRLRFYKCKEVWQQKESRSQKLVIETYNETLWLSHPVIDKGEIHQSPCLHCGSQRHNDVGLEFGFSCKEKQQGVTSLHPILYTEEPDPSTWEDVVNALSKIASGAHLNIVEDGCKLTKCWT